MKRRHYLYGFHVEHASSAKQGRIVGETHDRTSWLIVWVGAKTPMRVLKYELKIILPEKRAS